MLMSPRRTLISCGNSSILSLRITLPILVILGSPDTVTVEEFRGSLRIVLILMILNMHPLRPTRSWVKNPLDPVLNAASTNARTISQENKISPTLETATSKNRLAAACVRVIDIPGDSTPDLRF
jgi:hypothetical protein